MDIFSYFVSYNEVTLSAVEKSLQNLTLSTSFADPAKAKPLLLA